jgi:hypothetical protein
MVLNTEHFPGSVGQTFAGVVIQIDMRHLNATFLKAVDINTKPMILRRNCYGTGLQILDRMISAPMTELEFVGCGAKRQTKQLVPQAYSKYGQLSQELPYRLNGIGNSSRVARTVGKKYAVRLVRQNLLCRGRCRHNGNLTTERFENSEYVELDAEVERHNVEFVPVL